MKLSEVCSRYNLKEWEFAEYVRENGLQFTNSILHGMMIEDKNVENYVKGFARHKEYIKNEELRRKNEEEMEATRKKKAMANMLITSGFNFDGYRITKYSGYISGDDAMSVERGTSFLGFATSDTKDGLMASLSQIRRNALRELKEAAYDLGCNAVIGVDFDYITLDPQTANLSGGTTYQPYVFCVTANGNAVVIEKIEE